ncbi:unnamed protein product [Lathyrus sativus]|nr:unnamed protein product [Lathyrus sativus]
MASFLACRIEAKSFEFLGIPIGSNPRLVASWTNLVNKVWVMLADWKGKLLSFGGRITMLKYVIGSLSIFLMSFYKMSVTVWKELDRIQNRFLWGSSTKQPKTVWIAWNKVCRSTDLGGLGIKKMDLFNISLLQKWKWRILTEKADLWLDVLASRHGNIRLAVMGSFEVVPSNLVLIGGMT